MTALSRATWKTADHAENGDRSIAIFPFVPLTTVGDVRLFDLGGDDNRFSDAVVSDLNELFTELEAGEGPRALVIRASGKVWSNGLDVPTVAGSETVRSRPAVVNRASWPPPTSAHHSPPSASKVEPSGRPSSVLVSPKTRRGPTLAVSGS